MATIQQAIAEASKRIHRFEAKLLLAHCLGVGRTYLITHDKDCLPPTVLQRYEDCVRARENRMPVPYITGTQEFFGRSFSVTPDVLIPRPDTETLIEFILEKTSGKGPLSLLDLGTGSGCIAITLALENPSLAVTATDINEKSLAVAKNNATQLGAAVSFFLGDWFKALTSSKKFDLIVSNPPYIDSQDKHLENLPFEPIGALTDGFDGLTHIRHLITEAPQYLRHGGLLAFEHGWDQAKDVRSLFANTLWTDVVTIKDLGGNDRVTAATLI